MPTDLLVLAGLASEILERHGYVACGRRENGLTRVDFWSRDDGAPHRYELRNDDATVDEIVAACLALAHHEIPAPDPRRISHLS